MGQRSLGMFEGWAGVVGGVLQVGGITGFLENLNDFYEESDVEGTAWRALLASWHADFGTSEVSVSELFGPAIEAGLHLGDGSEQSQKVRLGKLLVEKRDRVFDMDIDSARLPKLTLVRAGTKRRATLWQLRETNG